MSSQKARAVNEKNARAVVLISGSGSNLQAFIDQINDGTLPIEISLVISNKPDAYGLERAQLADVPTLCLDHTSFDSRQDFDQALSKHIDAEQADIIILAGFMRILTEQFVNHYLNRLVNIHPSLLPKYPGNNTHERVLAAGDEWHGVSIHFVVPEVDAGPIILQGRLPVKKGDTAISLQERIHKIEHQLYPKAVKWFAQGRLTVEKDTVLLDGKNSSIQLQTFEV